MRATSPFCESIALSMCMLLVGHLFHYFIIFVGRVVPVAGSLLHRGRHARQLCLVRIPYECGFLCECPFMCDAQHALRCSLQHYIEGVIECHRAWSYA